MPTTHDYKAAPDTWIRIIPSDTDSPAGKLADAELHFTDQAAGPLAGLRITGFGIWAPRSANAGRNVTMPARTWLTNRGERRTYAIVRPAVEGDPTHALPALVASILEAYASHERADADRYQAEIDARRQARQDAWKATAEAAADAAGILDPDQAPVFQTDAERLAAGLAASRQPGGISILDMMPGGKYGKPRQAPRSTPDLEF